MPANPPDDRDDETEAGDDADDALDDLTDQAGDDADDALDDLTDQAGDEPADEDAPAEGEPQTWQPRRGWGTKLVAWAIIALVVLGSIVMLVAMIRSLRGR